MHHFHAWTMGFWGFVGEHTTSLIMGLNLTPIHALPHDANPRLDYVPIVNNLPPYKFVKNVKWKRDKKALHGHSNLCCKAFYDVIFHYANVEVHTMNLVEYCSRHRSKHKCPSRPFRFLDLGFLDENWGDACIPFTIRLFKMGLGYDLQWLSHKCMTWKFGSTKLKTLVNCTKQTWPRV